MDLVVDEIDGGQRFVYLITARMAMREMLHKVLEVWRRAGAVA